MTGAVRELGRGRLLLDLGFREREGLVASYLLPAPEGWLMVETGPTSSRPTLREGLAAAGIEERDVRQVLVTHIHLDHAGGVGALAEVLPNARFYVHPTGLPHLVDPERLAQSARRAWGPAADPLFGPILPAPADRLVPLAGGERLALRDGELEVLATPGHARHHLAFLDRPRGALLTGDAAGVRLAGEAHARPALPPPDLDLGALFESVARMRAAGARELWYTHFGPVEGPAGALDRYVRDVERWRDVALRIAREGGSAETIARALQEEDLPRGAAEDRGSLVSSYAMAAQGLLRYFRTQGLLPPEGR